MAHTVNNPLLKHVRGKMGDTFVIKQVGEKTILAAAPRRITTESPLQKANRSQFREATLYAKQAQSDPELREHFRAEAQRRKLPNPYTAALSFKLREMKAARLLTSHLTGQHEEQQLQETVSNAAETVSTAAKVVKGVPVERKDAAEMLRDCLAELQGTMAKVSELLQAVQESNVAQFQKTSVVSTLRTE
jgi:polynucleotide 5'-kinase involved in rRNA processing